MINPEDERDTRSTIDFAGHAGTAVLTNKP